MQMQRQTVIEIPEIQNLVQSLSILLKAHFCYLMLIEQTEEILVEANCTGFINSYFAEKWYQFDVQVNFTSHYFEKIQIWSAVDSLDYQYHFLRPLKRQYLLEEGVSLVKADEKIRCVISLATNKNRFDFYSRIASFHFLLVEQLDSFYNLRHDILKDFSQFKRRL